MHSNQVLLHGNKSNRLYSNQIEGNPVQRWSKTHPVTRLIVPLNYLQPPGQRSGVAATPPSIQTTITGLKDTLTNRFRPRSRVCTKRITYRSWSVQVRAFLSHRKTIRHHRKVDKAQHGSWLSREIWPRCLEILNATVVYRTPSPQQRQSDSLLTKSLFLRTAGCLASRTRECGCTISRFADRPQPCTVVFRG